MSQRQALEGIFVLDCSQILAGPFCSMMLADMGADVIKVEKPGGDDTRRFGPPFIKGESVAFMALNRNKRSIVLDFRDPVGREVLKRLVAKADVMLENYRPGTLERQGLGYADLKKMNPGLIYCSISGFGKTGPYAGRGGFDLVAQGMSGLMSYNGVPGQPPAKIAVPMADLNAGMFAFSGILAALVYRLRTGEGQCLETSLLESGLAYTVYESALYLAAGQVAGPMGSAHRLIAPYQAFATKDGWVNIGAANQANWERFATAIGRAELIAQERFKDNASRLVHRVDLEAELNKTMSSRTTAEWLPVLEAAGVPAGPIYDMAKVWSDPQVQAREMRVTQEHPVAGKASSIGNPIKMCSTPVQYRRASPTLGQHTDEILALAGCSEAEVADLKKRGVAGPAAKGASAA
ncbi:MAG: CoA transferase [Chloroflexi bacterium]|nr:CoA transferase [Chloroflexota bacterium]